MRFQSQQGSLNLKPTLILLIQNQRPQILIKQLKQQDPRTDTPLVQDRIDLDLVLHQNLMS